MVNRSMPDNDCKHIPGVLPPDGDFVTCIEPSVDSPPRRETRSPRFGSLHLLGEQVETPPLPPGLGNRQISADKHM